MKKVILFAFSAVLLSACAKGVKIAEKVETITVPNSNYFISKDGDLYSNGGELKSSDGIVYAISGRATQLDGTRLIEGEKGDERFKLQIFPEYCSVGYKAKFEDGYGEKDLCLQFVKKIAYNSVKAMKKKKIQDEMLENFP